MSDEKIHILQKALKREKLARREAEKILEDKSLELFNKTEELASINENLSKVIDEQTFEFNDIFDNIIDSYILIDLHGNVLKMNQPAKYFFGYDIDKEDFNVTDIIFEEDAQYAFNSFIKLKEEGFFTNYQSRIYTKAKTIKWVQINSRIIYDMNKKPRFAHGIVRDISLSKERQKEFEEQKQQLTAIVDYSSIGIVLTEGNKILKSNKAFENLIEYSEDELKELSVMDLLFSKYQILKSQSLIIQMEKGEIDNFTITKQYKSKYGKIIWAKTNVAAVRNSTGELKYQVAMIEDITEELKQGMLLEALNNLMSSILGKTNIYEIALEITNNTIGLIGFEDCVIYLVDDDKKQLNQVAAYGDKISEDNEFINKISIPIGEGIVGTVVKTGIPEIIPDTSKDKRYIIDNKIRCSEISVPIISNNEIIGVIDSKHSSKNFFTENHLKTLQTIASLAATQLKSALNLRMREKAEKEKELMFKNLKKSNQELNDFAHVVSHDLKSPLRGMNTLVNWLIEDTKVFTTPEITENFKLLLRRIDRMDLLINGILSYASVDKVEEVVKKVNIETIVEDILTTISIPDSFIIRQKSKLPILKGDPYKFIQLFQNLISNAVKYIDKESGVIEIDCTKKGKYWQFLISDNGKGISKKYFKKIFEIFQVLEGSENSTGIGLSIVKKIIDYYGGEIWVDSQLKEGTTFYFTLPV